jgi:hypothetical protein
VNISDEKIEYDIEQFQEILIWIEMLESEVADAGPLNKTKVKEISDRLARLGRDHATFLRFMTKKQNEITV